MDKPGSINKEKIEVSILLFMTLLFLVLGYFQFFYRPSGQTGVERDAAPKGKLIDVSEIRAKLANEDTAASARLAAVPLRHSIHDVFQPVNHIRFVPRKEQATPQLPRFILNGSVAGGKSPLVVINGRFLRQWEWIDGYQVVSITDKQVVLNSKRGRIELAMGTHE